MLLGLWSNEQVEMCGKVASQQSLVGGDVKEQSHGLHIEPRLQNLHGKADVLGVNTFRDSARFQGTQKMWLAHH